MRKKVGILFGGRSAEHEVSLQSAQNVYDAIDRTKFEPILIGIDKDGDWFLSDESGFLIDAENPESIKLNRTDNSVMLMPDNRRSLINVAEPESRKSIDVVFPLLHGPMGEDGTVQGLLRLAGIPFVGAGVLGSAIGLDKDVMKRLLRDSGLPVAPYIALRRSQSTPEYSAIVSEIGSPFFVKPANMGSSVGVSKVHDEMEYQQAVANAYKYDRKIIVEQHIAGREIECAVLGNAEPIVSVPGEIVTSHEFYSYQSKYIDEKGAILTIPAKLSEELTGKIQFMAKKAFLVLECEGLSRVDFFLTEENFPIINEINTIPGFTRISMYPKLWEASGITYSDLINRLIGLALERHREELTLQTRYE